MSTCFIFRSTSPGKKQDHDDDKPQDREETLAVEQNTEVAREEEPKSRTPSPAPVNEEHQANGDDAE